MPETATSYICINFILYWQHIHEVILDYRLTNFLTCLKREAESGKNLADLDLETFTKYFDESVSIWYVQDDCW